MLFGAKKVKKFKSEEKRILKKKFQQVERSDYQVTENNAEDAGL